MALISKVKIPDVESPYDIGAWRTASIPYGECDSTSTSTSFTATVPGITELRDGVCMLLRNGVVTSASGFTINVNGLGAKPSYNNMTLGNSVTPTDATRDTTIFNINYAMLFVYSTTVVSGGCWIGYRGYDANSNTIGYQLRTNSSTMVASAKFYRYRLLFTSADGTKWVPANTSTSTNATTKRDVNQTPIDPFGEIVWYGTTTVIEADATVTAAQLWQEYAGSYTSIGYSFNRTGAAQTMTANRPIYIKCAPQSNGSAIIDADTPYVQTLPNTEDGKIYILLGRAYSATNFELLMKHPIYYYKDGAIRIWTNPAVTGNIPTKTSDLTNDGSDGSHPFLATDDVVSTYSSTGTDPINGTGVAAALATLPTPMQFKGSVGTSGTIEWSALPTAGSSNTGYVYKVITDHSTTPICKAGDTIVSNGSEWVVIPSGDEPSGTVTSVGITQGSGISVSGGPITSSGSITVAHASTSSASSVTNTGNTVIQSISVDGFGHVTDLSSKTLSIPSAPGTLDTTATTAQSTSSAEALSGSITLHKVSKTGDYGDLLNKPTDASGIVTLAHGGTGISSDDSSWYSSTDLHPQFIVIYNGQAFSCGYLGPYDGISSVATALSSDSVKMALSSEVPVRFLSINGSLLFNGTIITGAIASHPEYLQILFPDSFDMGDGDVVNGISGTLTFDSFEGLFLTDIALHVPYWWNNASQVVGRGIGDSPIGDTSTPIFWNGANFDTCSGGGGVTPTTDTLSTTNVSSVSTSPVTAYGGGGTVTQTVFSDTRSFIISEGTITAQLVHASGGEVSQASFTTVTADSVSITDVSVVSGLNGGGNTVVIGIS